MALSPSIAVRFTADTADLSKGLADARTNVAGFAPGATTPAKADVDQLKSSLDGLNATMAQASERSAEAGNGWRANIATLAQLLQIFTFLKNGLEEVVDVEVRGDVLLAQSLARIGAAQGQVNRDAFAAIGTGAAAAGGAIEGFSQRAETALAETKAQIVDFMKQYHLMIGSVADAAPIMAVAAAGGLDALEGEVDRAAAATREKMAQMEADYQHAQRAFAQRDPGSGREVATPVNDQLQVVGDSYSDESDSARLATSHAADMAAAEASIKSVDDTLEGFISDLQEIPDTSKEVATAIEAAFTTLPGYTLEANEAMIAFVKSVSASGDEARDMAAQLKAALADGEHGGATLAAMFAKIEDAESRVAQSAGFGKMLQPSQAVAFYAAIKEGIDRQKAGLEAVDADYLAQQGKLNTVGRFLEGIVGSTKAEHAANQATLAALQEQSDQLGRQVGLYTQLADKAKQLKDFSEAMKAAGDTPSATLSTLTKRRDTLDGRPQQTTVAEAGVAAVERDTLARLAILEAGGEGAKGIEAMVNVVRNRLQNGGFGASLDAVMSKPKQFSAYDKDKLAAIDSDSDAYRQSRAIVDKQLGPDPNADVTRGATHYLNPDTATDKSWVDKMTNVTDIGKHKFGNVDTDPVLSDADEVKRREAVEKTSTAIRQQQDLIVGGTAAERLKVDLAERGLTQARDAVAEAQQLVDVARQGVDKAQDGNAGEREKARAALVQAETELKAQEVARDRAAETLKTAALKEGTQARYDAELAALAKQEDAEVAGSAKWSEIEEKKQALTERFEAAKVAAGKASEELLAAQAAEGSQAQLAHKLAAIDVELAAATAGTAKYIDLEKQKVELQRTAAKAATADAVAEEAVKYNALQKGFKDEQERIKENTKLKGTSAGQEYADLLASYAREATAARAHFAELERLYADDPKQYRTAMREKAEVDAQLNSQRLAAERQLQGQILEQYKSTYEAIGSTVSSGIMGMIEKTTTLKQVGQNIAKQLVQQFIEARIRMVADWAAGETAKILATTVGETAKTTAVATGEAARTGLVSAGAATQAASTGLSMVKSILGSAAETFAGIFGFLSPVLGPAAVGPAAAGQAAVAAVVSSVPSFAIGAWSLPSDTLAQVHAGEMIVPKGPAALMRAAAGGGGAQGGGGDVHQHTHFNVTAMDSRDVRRFFGDNAKHIIGAINDGVRSGSHLGLSKLKV